MIVNGTNIHENIRYNFGIKESKLVIQKFDKEFQEYVDVDDVSDIKGGDKLIVNIAETQVSNNIDIVN